MVFSPAWGGFSPIPLVQKGALRDWLETVRGLRKGVPIQKGVVYTPAAGIRNAIMAVAGAGLMAAYARIVGVAPERVDSGQLFRDIQQFLRSERRVQVSQKRSPRGGKKAIPGPPLEPGDHDYEEAEEFLAWFDRRRYRGRGRFYTPDVRRSI